MFASLFTFPIQFNQIHSNSVRIRFQQTIVYESSLSILDYLFFKSSEMIQQATVLAPAPLVWICFILLCTFVIIKGLYNLSWMEASCTFTSLVVFVCASAAMYIAMFIAIALIQFLGNVQIKNALREWNRSRPGWFWWRLSAPPVETYPALLVFLHERGLSKRKFCAIEYTILWSLLSEWERTDCFL